MINCSGAVTVICSEQIVFHYHKKQTAIDIRKKQKLSQVQKVKQALTQHVRRRQRLLKNVLQNLQISAHLYPMLGLSSLNTLFLSALCMQRDKCVPLQRCIPPSSLTAGKSWRNKNDNIQHQELE